MPTDSNLTNEDTPMFAPIPSWERNKKRRGFGRSRVAAEPRSFAPAETDAPMFDAAPASVVEADRLSAVDPVNTFAPISDVEATDGTFAAPPVYATRTKAKSSSAPVAIAAGLILIGGVAAAGWYYSQPHGQSGVAELTPGASTTTTTTATTPDGQTTSAQAPAQTAEAAPPPAAARSTSTSTTTTRTASAARTRAPVSRVRSAAAADSGSDASTTAPAQAAPMPMPTPGVAPPASAQPAAPAPLVLTVPPAAAAPQAAPQPVVPQTVTPQAAPPVTQVPQT